LFKEINRDALMIHHSMNKSLTHTKWLATIAMLGSFAAILQSAGGFLPGIGYLISPFATTPILICTIYSVSTGWVAYFLTLGLLLVLIPSELFVFPFTTGLLGIGLGIGFLLLKKRLWIILISSFILTLGIAFLLYIIQFPVLGPAVSSTFHASQLLSIFLFSLLYSWIWVEGSTKLLKYLNKNYTGR
jgi:hypothetical protein